MQEHLPKPSDFDYVDPPDHHQREWVVVQVFVACVDAACAAIAAPFKLVCSLRKTDGSEVERGHFGPQ